MEVVKNRILILDSFRGVAILMVVFYHYFASWTFPEFKGNYYPYGDHFREFFKYGFFGVQFFFIISGFVIFYTLEKSQLFSDFMLKRVIRLFPAMLVCSIITYFLMPILDSGNKFSVFHSSTALDFLPSLTFTSPDIWNGLLPGNNINYICGVYWSLWVEMTFYIFVSIIYFININYFLRNWCIFVIVVTLFRLLQSPDINISSDQIRRIFSVVNFFRYTTYFTIGILFYSIYTNKKISILFYSTSAILFLLELAKLNSIWLRIMLVGIIALFLIFLYKPSLISFLEKNLFYTIGVSSYVLYLIHEYIGIVFINWSSAYIPSYLHFFIPIFTIAVMVILSLAINKYIEIPFSMYLKKGYSKLKTGK